MKENKETGASPQVFIPLSLPTPLPTNHSPHHPSKKERLKNLANTRTCGGDALLGGSRARRVESF